MGEMGVKDRYIRHNKARVAKASPLSTTTQHQYSIIPPAFGILGVKMPSREAACRSAVTSTTVQWKVDYSRPL